MGSTCSQYVNSFMPRKCVVAEKWSGVQRRKWLPDAPKTLQALSKQDPIATFCYQKLSLPLAQGGRINKFARRILCATMGRRERADPGANNRTHVLFFLYILGKRNMALSSLIPYDINRRPIGDDGSGRALPPPSLDQPF